jgi:predicted SAM-dependent methyltransferase
MRKLHLGGTEKKDGWEILNLTPSDITDHVCDAANLKIFQDYTFDVIYASHILEHFDYNDTSKVLLEWKRVLKPSGELYISVPDLKQLALLMLFPNLTVSEQFHVSRMIYGGHIDRLDHHHAGFTKDVLATRLIKDAEFSSVELLDNLPYGFSDCSHLVYKGIQISLNVKATK